jgi:hypothetical protein
MQSIATRQCAGEQSQSSEKHSRRAQTLPLTLNCTLACIRSRTPCSFSAKGSFEAGSCSTYAMQGASGELPSPHTHTPGYFQKLLLGRSVIYWNAHLQTCSPNMLVHLQDSMQHFQANLYCCDAATEHQGDSNPAAPLPCQTCHTILPLTFASFTSTVS